jgi:hypothetical protein
MDPGYLDIHELQNHGSMFPSTYMREPIPDWGKHRNRLHNQGRKSPKRKEQKQLNLDREQEASFMDAGARMGSASPEYPKWGEVLKDLPRRRPQSRQQRRRPGALIRGRRSRIKRGVEVRG